MSVSFQALDGPIAIIQVSRPHVRNALDWDAMEAFAEAVETAHAQKDLRALIITGQGDVFIAGGDLKVLHDSTTEADGWRLTKTMTHALNRLEALPCPVIAAINGPARGGGAEIALACDIRIAAKNADLGLVQVTLGLIPGWGGGQRLLRLVGYSQALTWLGTGEILNTEAMLRYSLVNQVTPAGEALNQAQALARAFCQQPREAVQAIKALLQTGLTSPAPAAASYEQSLFPPLWASEDHLQAVDHWIQGRQKK